MKRWIHASDQNSTAEDEFDRQWEEKFGPDDESIQLGDDLDLDDILDWFYDYYNKVIAPILPIDEIKHTSIIDRGDSLFIRAKGLQYYSTCPRHRFRECRKAIISRCKLDDVICNMYASDFGDDEEYRITLTVAVPLEGNLLT